MPAKNRRGMQVPSRSPAKLKLFVKSKKVPVGVREFSVPSARGPWGASQSHIRAVVYEVILDDAQTRLMEEAKLLSNGSGLRLEVVDLGRMNPLKRLFWSRILGPGLNPSLGSPAPAPTERLPCAAPALPA